MLSDIDGLYDSDTHKNAQAKLIDEVTDMTTVSLLLLEARVHYSEPVE